MKNIRLRSKDNKKNLKFVLEYVRLTKIINNGKFAETERKLIKEPASEELKQYFKFRKIDFVSALPSYLKLEKFRLTLTASSKKVILNSEKYSELMKKNLDEISKLQTKIKQLEQANKNEEKRIIEELELKHNPSENDFYIQAKT